MKCINCSNKVEKGENFCPRCGNPINRKFWIRAIVLGIVAAILPFIILNYLENWLSIVSLFGAYIVCAIVVEFVLKVNTRKEALFSSIYGILFQLIIIFAIAVIDPNAAEVEGVLIIAIMLLELVYVPVLLAINFIVNLIFGKKPNKIVNNNSN